MNHPRLIPYALLFLSLLSLGACKKEEPATPPPQAEPSAPPPFAPPGDGMASSDQVKRYALARRSMAEINGAYLDSLATVGPDGRQPLLRALEVAKDVTARKYGLNGYAEYEWLSESAAQNPENKPVFEAAGLLLP